MAVSVFPTPSAGRLVQKSQEFLTTGTWTAPPSCFSVDLFLVGGGGGSGAANNEASRPGGAGGGGQVLKTTIAVIPGTTYSVVIGAGGAPRTKGGDSSFGNLATAFGGANSYDTQTSNPNRYASNFYGTSVGSSGGMAGSGNENAGNFGMAGGGAGGFDGHGTQGRGNGYWGGNGGIGIDISTTNANQVAAFASTRGGAGIDGFGGGGGGIYAMNGDFPGGSLGRDGGGNGKMSRYTALPAGSLQTNGLANKGGGAGWSDSGTTSGGSGFARIIFWEVG